MVAERLMGAVRSCRTGYIWKYRRRPTWTIVIVYIYLIMGYTAPEAL